MGHPPTRLDLPRTPGTPQRQGLRPSPGSLVELELNTPTADSRTQSFSPGGQPAGISRNLWDRLRGARAAYRGLGAEEPDIEATVAGHGPTSVPRQAAEPPGPSTQHEASETAAMGSSQTRSMMRLPVMSEEGEDTEQRLLSSNRRSTIGSLELEEPLLFLTLLGVLAGILLGSLIRLAHPSKDTITLIGLPGEILLRLLKMLVLPLVAGSMIAGVCSLRGSGGSMARVARLTLAYYALTTVAAVLLGILLVILIQPGRGSPFSKAAAGGDCETTAAQDAEERAKESGENAPILKALLNVLRNMFPDNIVSAAVDMNILGIITFSLFFGISLVGLGDEAASLIQAINAFNAVIGRMVSAVLWVSPLGVASLIAAAICNACDLLGTAAALGLWIGTVLGGLAIFAGLLLPALLWAATRCNPFQTLRGFSPALLLGFGTGSSAASLPVAMECATRLGCSDSIVRFVLPLGTTVNMNGTALYEATTVIFIAQAHGVSLGLAQTLVVACTSTLAAVGAAAIPSAGLVTMLMVLQAVSLDRFAADLAVVLAVDWLLDRCRTAVNLMGDTFGTFIIDKLCQKESSQGDEVLATSLL
ncbi:hypothetical protein WJX84_010959 [Apatococcus fuscideae]|uniref:Amino acid transporter n=1 Tax=Apatococcus fuscideae TaxID=2026836 RepID=A0AAW1SNU1_9CHLO